MDHQNLPLRYDRLLLKQRNRLNAKAVMLIQHIARDREKVGAMPFLELVGYHKFLRSEVKHAADKALDQVSALRNRSIEDDVLATVSNHGEIRVEHAQRIRVRHHEHAKVAEGEIDRIVRVLLAEMLTQLSACISEGMAQRLQVNSSRPSNSSPVLSLLLVCHRRDLRFGRYLYGFLFMGALHATPILQSANHGVLHFLLFAGFNSLIMWIRFDMLVVHRRNGRYARLLHVADMVSSVVLFGCLLDNCDKLYGSTQDLSGCFKELLIGLGIIVLFHIAVILAVRNLLDENDKDKRKW